MTIEGRSRRPAEWLVAILVPSLIFVGGVVAYRASTTSSAEAAGPSPVVAAASPSASVPSAPPSRSLTPTPSPSASTPRSSLALLSAVPIATSRSVGYERDQFGPGWEDPDRNGCDARNDTLKRDLTDTTFKPGTHDCVVLTGRLDDRYTGKQIDFVRGFRTSEAVEIDHVVPLSWAWQYGASGWSAALRVQFANDPKNLLAVDGEANMSKSDSGPSAWLPPDQSEECDYAQRWVAVLSSYPLSVPSSDRAELVVLLKQC